MKLNKNLTVSETGFIFNPSTGDSFSANTIGAEVLNLLKEGQGIEEIKKNLTDRYDVEKTVLEKDIDDFIVLLRDNNLLQYEQR